MINKFLENGPLSPGECEADLDVAMEKAISLQENLKLKLNPHMTEKNQILFSELWDKLRERELWKESLSNAEFKESNEVRFVEDGHTLLTSYGVVLRLLVLQHA